MATIVPTLVPQDDGTLLALWSAVTHADSGGSTQTAIDASGNVKHRLLSGHPDKTVSASGTFAGGLSLALEGSPDGSNWFPCHAAVANATFAVGGAIALTATLQAAIVAENFKYYRLTRTSGSGSTVTVYLSCAK